jgi:ligand-binding sensor domain-containing protein
MKKLPLLFIFTCFNSCNGQTKSREKYNSQPISKPISIGQPKIVTTQNSGTSGNIRCGLEDRYGNLWFGTTGEGVYRYDGKVFYNYTVKDGLLNNNVMSILEDKAGNIWFGTIDGICRYDGKNIKPISIPSSIRPFVSFDYYTSSSTKNTVWSMLQDKRGKIWFGTGDGVHIYNGNIFSRFLQNDGVVNKEDLHLKMIDCILEDNKGIIWFASGMPPGMEGICMYDGKSISSLKPNGDSWIRLIVKDKKGNLWFSGRAKGNFIFDGKDFTKFTEKLGIGNPLLVDNAGKIWFGGEERLSTVENEGGIWRYDGKSFKNYTINDGISKYAVFSMLQDKKGNIWFGTRNTGLYKFDGKNFTNYSE